VFRACFPREAHADVLAEVKRLADALGERRDRDIAIAALEDFKARLPIDDRPSVESLILTLRGEQARANQRVSSHVSADRLAALRRRVSELIAAAERSRVTEGPSPGADLRLIGPDGTSGDPPAARASS
jgi:CHAD domain-containing protein